MYKKVDPIPVKDKIGLSIPEAAEYSGIGLNKIDELLRDPYCTFVLYVGKKKLVKRKEFEEYFSRQVAI